MLSGKSAMANLFKQKKTLFLLVIGSVTGLIVIGLLAVGAVFFFFNETQPTATGTALPTAEPVAKETPGEVGLSVVVLASPTPAATETDIPASPTGDPATPAAQATSTPRSRISPTAPPPPPTTPASRPSQPAIAGTVELVSPENEQHTPGNELEFRWRWQQVENCQRPPEGYAFEIRVWLDRDDAAPTGAMNAKEEKENIRCDPATGIYAFTVGIKQVISRNTGRTEGRFRWDVVLVRLDPYEPVIIPAEFRIIFF